VASDGYVNTLIGQELRPRSKNQNHSNDYEHSLWDKA